MDINIPLGRVQDAVDITVGQIFAGVSDVPVPDIRVCTEFESFIANGGRFERQNKTGFTNFARTRRVINSDPKDKTAYTVTESLAKFEIWIFCHQVWHVSPSRSRSVGQRAQSQRVRSCKRGYERDDAHLAAYVSDPIQNLADTATNASSTR